MFLLSSLRHAHQAQTQAHMAFNQQDWRSCISYYGKKLQLGYSLNKHHSEQFNIAKKQYRDIRKKQRNEQTNINTKLTIAVSSWEMSHNAVGRALALSQLYQYSGFKTRLIGCIIQSKTNNYKKLWQPLDLSLTQLNIDCDYFSVKNSTDLLFQAFEFIRNNPVDIVHLSKPRLPNIIIGRLYQLLWDAHVIMDIDDEELGFGNNLQNNYKNSSHPNKQQWKTIRSDYWLHHCVDLARHFDATTVSNISLQNKYSGMIIPHVRNRDEIMPSKHLSQVMREKHQIPIDSWVVLFFGTPKPHKGLLETAQALSKIDRNDVLFLIIGDFIDSDFKKELQSVNSVNFQFLPNQPFSEIANFVAMGDVCVLMQDMNSLISEHQLPAKIIDALAMGLTVVSSYTPALQPLIESKAVISTTSKDLPKTLSKIFNQNRYNSFNKIGYKYFNNKLSTQAHVDNLHQLIENVLATEVFHPYKVRQKYNLQYITKIFT